MTAFQIQALNRGSYTVKSGDSLQKISHSLFGDSRYWYLIADANGLSPTEKPLTGQVLLVPNIHAQTFNGTDSFKPYNESEVLGDINPEPNATTTAKEKLLNPIAQIIMVAVAVVVTVYTGAAAMTLVVLQPLEVPPQRELVQQQRPPLVERA